MSALDKLLQQDILSQEDMLDLLHNRSAYADTIKQAATEKRQAAYSNKVFIRGLIELSSYCKQDCYYCGLRRSNPEAKRYRLSAEVVLDQAKRGYDLGVRTFVLQGGEDPHFTDERLIPLVQRLKQLYPDVAITLSLGERPKESYQKLWDAGADRYLLRHETADEEHYQILHPKPMQFSSRRKALLDLKEIGFQTGAGMMVGSPGQTMDTLAKDLLFLQELKPQMVGIGPFIHAGDTPFANEPDGDVSLTLYLLQLVRLLLPNALIPATTALATKDEAARMEALITSANVVMPNLTPAEKRADYAIYENKRAFALEAIEGLDQLRQLLEDNQLSLDLSRGDYKELNHVQSR